MKEGNKSKTAIVVIVFSGMCILGSICMGYFFSWYGGLDEEMLIKFHKGDIVVEKTEDGGVRTKTWSGIDGGGIAYSVIEKLEKESLYITARMYHVFNQEGIMVTTDHPAKDSEFKAFYNFLYNRNDSMTDQYAIMANAAKKSGANYVFIVEHGGFHDTETSGWGIGTEGVSNVR